MSSSVDECRSAQTRAYSGRPVRSVPSHVSQIEFARRTGNCDARQYRNPGGVLENLLFSPEDTVLDARDEASEVLESCGHKLVTQSSSSSASASENLMLSTANSFARQGSLAAQKRHARSDVEITRRRIEEIQKQQRAQRALQHWVIDPRRSRLISFWDTVTALALIFTAIVTPYEVSFSNGEPNLINFVLNRSVDVIFTCDIVLQFFIAFPESANYTGQGSQWVMDHRRVIRHYLRGWFGIDLVSTLVAVFDVVSFTSGDSSLQRLQVLRVLRVLRLTKLLRLLRGSRVFRRIELR